MTQEDLAALRTAVRLLEHPGLAARLTNLVGKPIDLINNALPAAVSRAIATATAKGLEAALKVALRTMQHTPHAGSQLLHKALATASGAAGGAFGLATLPIELPVSTIIMLRSIADIARSEGEDLSDPESAGAAIIRLLDPLGYSVYLWDNDAFVAWQAGKRSVNYFFLRPAHLEHTPISNLS